MSNYPFERAPRIYPAGSLLVVKAYGVIRHYGLATGYGTVIHASRRFGKVEETDMAAFAQGNIITLVPYAHTLSGAEIVARARLKKGQRYNVIINNCEHFITWVLEGKGRSPQLGPLDGRRLSRD
ncbi:lecithin retinol acyltransferase family protein [Litorimonas sp. RW-G-Af-16]|uniref:lecithin retinol acyltransferase family protein n=1 Tax=Litorimonas sp. RW-G-Af-16 TaxID=3241168 RepID=UPI00390C4760